MPMPSILVATPNQNYVSTGIAGATNLTDFKGKLLVLYFYPKDSTPGCTQQGQDFRDHYDEFKTLNAEIIGVSRDSLKSHINFKTKQQFPFELIADTDEALCRHYQVIKMKNMYGKQVLGIERSTFLIDPNGELVREWRKVSVKGHWQEVLQDLQDLSQH
ncbi:MAG: peroxiredoxin [Gammaproteobacteria bacterium]|nr:peroxiredoxin [Gammaproteobacteria bacterium]